MLLHNFFFFQILTSIISQHNTVWHSLSTVNISLMHLEIGDCVLINEDFAILLKRFVNLTFLRLEKYNCRIYSVTQEVFRSIKNLKKLTSLQLVNIHFNDTVKREMENCDNIKTLLIIPIYYIFVSIFNNFLFIY